MEVCTLASSSSGNCALVSHGDTHILIDAGISMRRIRESLGSIGLLPGDISGIIVTHEHSDHIGGVRMLVKHYGTAIFASWGTREGILSSVPEAEPCVTGFDTGAEFEIGGLLIKSFKTPHDAAESVGYILSAEESRLAFVTDLGCVTAEIMDAVLGVGMAVIEANHDMDMLKNGKYPYFLKRRILSDSGHLSNGDSGDLAAMLAKAGARYILLAHLSRENNKPELARGAVERALRESGAAPGRDVCLEVAPPDRMSGRYVI